MILVLTSSAFAQAAQVASESPIAWPLAFMVVGVAFAVAWSIR